ncbi:MAG: bifunctional adenosylcobinamide kinase/adenosylcobinamide-phosphate guanylyltransferase [Butyrivibrio sp.]|nr:bifunctional adenosylcobinamide kinase/adenosylcobinamide-phosphate guanylyltransferase [Butyrivibrio sp.]
MIHLIIGEPDSGKSALAEEMAQDCGGPVYYLATMLVMDEKGQKRRERHRKQRAGRGFVTLEIPYRIDRALESIGNPGECTVLLECLSNLVGNEMHENPERTALWREGDGARFVQAILTDVLTLADGVRALIVVTNEYRAAPDYDEETRNYIRLLSMLNQALMPHAETVRDLRSAEEKSLC